MNVILFVLGVLTEFVGVPCRGASNDSGVVRIGDFLVISVAVSSKSLQSEANIIMRSHEMPYLLSADRKMLDLE